MKPQHDCEDFMLKEDLLVRKLRIVLLIALDFEKIFTYKA